MDKDTSNFIKHKTIPCPSPQSKFEGTQCGTLHHAAVYAFSFILFDSPYNLHPSAQHVRSYLQADKIELFWSLSITGPNFR
jgi:hypothetical protein